MLRSISFVVLLAGCAPTPPPPGSCNPGTSAPCACPTGSGVMVCESTAAFGACQCHLAPPPPMMYPPPPVDAGMELVAPTPPPPDTGPPSPVIPTMCAPVVTPAAMGNRCSVVQLDAFTAEAATSTNWREMVQRWLADPSKRECASCVHEVLMNGVTMGGCAQQYGNVVCCTDAVCGMATDRAPCEASALGAGGPCAERQASFFECYDTLPTLMVSVGVCYMTS